MWCAWQAIWYYWWQQPLQNSLNVIKARCLSNYLTELSQTEQTRLVSVPPAEYVQEEMLMYCNHLSRLSPSVTNRSYIVFCLWQEACFAKYFTGPSPNLYNAVCHHTKKWWSSWNTFKGWEVCAQFLVAKVTDCRQMKLVMKRKSAVLILIDLLQCMFFYFIETVYGFINKLCRMNIRTATDVRITLLTMKN